MPNKYVNHRRSQGVQWVHLHPQGGETFLGVIYRENVCVHPQDTTCTPQPEEESIFMTVSVGTVF